MNSDQTLIKEPDFQTFVKVQADELRAADAPPESLSAWKRQNALLRAHLLEAWGGFPPVPCPLDPHKVGELQRDGYRVEKILFQTLPGVLMTANAYVPDRPGKLPAVLAVHGHWAGAKQDPVVQARNIGLAKLGFFVLAVDAFGAGERGVGKALGEYHGAMTAATLLPVGTPLSGLQVYENMRAVDYLLTRPEVDGQRIGITGASGGGNQSMYSGAWDERLAASVPVCSVSNYRTYLGVACCLCEVVPGVLRFTEQGNVLGLVAPRALLVINGSLDVIQFSPPEAAKSIARARAIYDLFGGSSALRHEVFPSPHDYSRPMREAMYGWMTKYLKGEGDGAPIPDPEMTLEDPESLRCFPGDSRLEDFLTIPKFAAREARRILDSQAATASGFRTRKPALLDSLEQKVFGGLPPRTPVRLLPPTGPDTISFESEPGIHLTASRYGGKSGSARLVLVLNLDKTEENAPGGLVGTLLLAGWTVVVPELRAAARLAIPHDIVRDVPDHKSAEWAMAIGRPLLAQWTHDVRRTLDALDTSGGPLPAEVAVIGRGPSGVVALCAAALDPRITRAVTMDSLASYVTDVPYVGQRLGIMAPGILRDVGDIPRIAALIAPRSLVVAGGVSGDGRALELSALRRNYEFTREVFASDNAANNFTCLASASEAEVVASLPGTGMKKEMSSPYLQNP
jgi:cephalosporin-C deacetylase-like acetyl esterase